MSETQESKPIESSNKHKITAVMVDNGWGTPEKMYKLYVKHNGSWYWFRRAYFRPYGLRELQSLAENYDPGSGYFCTHGKGCPLEEFEDLPLREFTSIEDCGDYYSFIGNHKHYSGAFGYKIFDPVLAEKIESMITHAERKEQ